jgi:RimJ/RimL family protein N-acetyltransferase
LLEIGFSEYDFHRIYGRCDARNVGSYRVMERLGMRREAHFVESEFFKGEWSDELFYAILQDEWARQVENRGERWHRAGSRRDGTFG